MSEEPEKALASVYKRYAENTALRAAFQVIPCVGGAIDTLLSGKALAYQQRRIDQFIADTHENFKVIAEEKIDKTFLESEEFFTIFQLTMEKVIRTHDNEKIKLLSNAFVNVVSDPPDIAMAETVLNIISELQPSHVVVLQRLVVPFGFRYVEPETKMVGAIFQFATLRWILDTYQDFDRQALELICSDLARRNLLKETDESISFVVTANGGKKTVNYDDKAYEPTFFARLVIRFLKLSVESSGERVAERPGK